ncbi:ion channel [Novilysobacter spongiicola]|uniref:Ion channel n=1 Tax=Lysobacter spongiicola DSM 21749 TaxID=1122188 RepID=A0A1T4S818_9GAMM|nr:ion channel [Lysobacter spongiicola]SKA23981.1 Ion channel [Lysobacter spongiicola DSM 21749]
MQDGWLGLLVVAVVGLVTVTATVLIHHEGLQWIDRLCFGNGKPRRRSLVLSVLLVLSLHIVHILLYGVGFWGIPLLPLGGWIGEQGATATLTDAFYLSAINYSTLGMAGDLMPTGPIRLLVALESIAGLLMLTWSASFTYNRLSRKLGGDDSGQS